MLSGERLGHVKKRYSNEEDAVNFILMHYADKVTVVRSLEASDRSYYNSAIRGFVIEICLKFVNNNESRDCYNLLINRYN